MRIAQLAPLALDPNRRRVHDHVPPVTPIYRTEDQDQWVLATLSVRASLCAEPRLVHTSRRVGGSGATPRRSLLQNLNSLWCRVE
jgi:hypothetical protein